MTSGVMQISYKMAVVVGTSWNLAPAGYWLSFNWHWWSFVVIRWSFIVIGGHWWLLVVIQLSLVGIDGGLWLFGCHWWSLVVIGGHWWSLVVIQLSLVGIDGYLWLEWFVNNNYNTMLFILCFNSFIWSISCSNGNESP